MKSLNRILILIKVVRVLCLILFGLSIAGAAGCIAAIPLLVFLKDTPLPDGTTIATNLLKNGITVNMAYTYMACSVLWSGVSIFLSYYIASYLKKVLIEKTPFTRMNVKRTRKVAVVHICVNLAAIVLTSIACAITVALDSEITKMTYNSYYSLGFPIFLLILSLFLEYPVEKEELSKKREEEALKPEDYIE